MKNYLVITPQELEENKKIGWYYNKRNDKVMQVVSIKPYIEKVVGVLNKKLNKQNDR